MRNELLDRYIECLLTQSEPDAPVWNVERSRHHRAPHWNYVDGCMMTALWSLYEQTGDARYRDFVAKFADTYVADDGTPLGYQIEEYNLDNINGGRVLFDLYEATGNPKYSRAIDLLYKQLQNQPRTDEGSFWHKQIYPHQVWLDGLYMAQVFYTRWANAHGGVKQVEDIFSQFKTVRRRLWVEDKKLYCHGYDASRSVFWADKQTGRSLGFWLRAMGWYAVAMADVLDYLPQSTDKEVLAAQFREMIDGLLPYQDGATGMFYQVVDQGAREGNYLETSGSAMLSYAMLKGARLGYLPAEYRERGRRVFEGICKNHLSEGENGLFHLGSICLVAGLGPADNLRRDGSFAYYISEPVVNDDAKGVAPFVMCYTEVLRLT